MSQGLLPNVASGDESRARHFLRNDRETGVEMFFARPRFPSLPACSIQELPELRSCVEIFRDQFRDLNSRLDRPVEMSGSEERLNESRERTFLNYYVTVSRRNDN